MASSSCVLFIQLHSFIGCLLVQTLKHSDRRAAYDAIVGISGDAINPFTDTSFERDQVLQYTTQCLHACMYAFMWACMQKACCLCTEMLSTPPLQVFVDELTCIGCRNCTNVCPNTYQMEPDFGRARAMAQKVDNDEMLQESLDCCPVDCIHWVSLRKCGLSCACHHVFAVFSNGRVICARR